MGASNELPESEELDALYDRFLIRRQVAQVSAAQLSTLAKLAAGQLWRAIASENGASTHAPVEAAPSPTGRFGDLNMSDFRSAR